jgi:methionyl-tRNA formyltransferase
MSAIKIGYFADGPWAHRAFEMVKANSEMNIKFICARWDNPDARLQEYAKAFDIPFLVEKNINSDYFREKLTEFQCDLFISMSFNQIFTRPLYSLPPLGTINCHAGKLPFYRGRNILNWALINDEKEFGITVHYVDDGIDTGDIICQSVYEITDDDTYATLLKRAYVGCADVLFEAVEEIRMGKVRRLAQCELDSPGFYCSQRILGDEKLSWKQSSREIFNFVRAICTPGPQARTFLRDEEIMIDRVRMVPRAPIYKGIPGTVLSVNEQSFVVKTMDSYIEVMEWSGIERLRVGDRLG